LEGWESSAPTQRIEKWGFRGGGRIGGVSPEEIGERFMRGISEKREEEQNQKTHYFGLNVICGHERRGIAPIRRLLADRKKGGVKRRPGSV